MITIRHLGTCSGTEPTKNLHHLSFILQVNGVNYWFDAGENCAHYAYLSGIDVMQTRALFISHPHIDHVGGMANIFHTINKLRGRYRRQLIDKSLKVFIPYKDVLDAVKLLVSRNRGVMDDIYEYNPMHDGVIFEDENVKVTAIHNYHLRESGQNGWHSYSFLIEAEGKRIVFSGDVGCPYELNALLEKECDLLMHETGHHKVKDVIDYAVSKNVKHLRFIHHGREIIDHTQECLDLVKKSSEKYGIPMEIAFDLETIEI